MCKFYPLFIDNNAPLDDKICNKKWKCHGVNKGEKYRINHKGWLETIEKQDIESLNQFTEPNEKWIKMIHFNGSVHIQDRNNKATIIILQGAVNSAKINN